MRYSLDTETTGLDLRHGARPFLVTIAWEEGGEVYNDWTEWSVCPYTRKVRATKGGLYKVQRWIDRASELVLQNPKFDITGLHKLFEDHDMELRLDWSKVRDTLLAGHLLRSNVKPFEDVIEKATKQCRSRAQGKYPEHEWRIAAKDLPEMPSAKEKTWKYDMWLPRYVAKLDALPKNHSYWTACSDYANSDSSSTLMLYAKFEELIAEKGLEAIYQERLKILPIVYQMENVGITVNKSRFDLLTAEYLEASKEAAKKCVQVAKEYDYELTLPKSGNNKSLIEFCFGRTIKDEDGEEIGAESWLDLEPFEVSKKTGVPSLNKRSVEHYTSTLTEDSHACVFIANLAAKRSRDTALNYMESYARYWIPMGVFNALGEQLWFCLYPSLNATGTDTLRWSSSNPNEQNISKKKGFNLRYGFGPAPGREWWSGDAKNIELRIPAYESGQQELIELFERPDDPPYYGSTHLLNFHTVYPDIWEKNLKKVGFDKVGPHCKEHYASTWYQYCKNGGFAVQYGAVETPGREGTADKAFHRLGSHAKLKSRFKKLEGLNKYWIDYATKHGYVETLPDKTVDPSKGYPIWCTYNKWGKHVAPTIPLNYHVQSTAMWWMMKAMIRVQEYLDGLNARPHSKGYYMILQVHDELVFDFPKGKGKEPWKTNLPKIRKIKRLMEEGGNDIGIPTPVAFEYHPKNWSESVGIAVSGSTTLQSIGGRIPEEVRG
jgi:DNA polymerase I-like protein with 3'-5' exonuclease and polymerase domains